MGKVTHSGKVSPPYGIKFILRHAKISKDSFKMHQTNVKIIPTAAPFFFSKTCTSENKADKNPCCFAFFPLFYLHKTKTHKSTTKNI